VGQLGVGPVDRPPPLGDIEDGVDLLGQDAMHRVAARRPVHQRPGASAPGPPPVHPVIGHLPQRAHARVREPVCDGVVDGLEDQLVDLGGDPRRERSAQPQPDFPRLTVRRMPMTVDTVDLPLAGRVGLGDLPRSHLQEDLPLRLRGQLRRPPPRSRLGHRLGLSR
jgi:hypothetical protein